MEGVRKFSVLVTFLVIFTAEVHGQRPGGQVNNGFDVFIYALNWPYTGCYTVKRNGANKNCNLPDTKRWTIHGLWPSKFGVFGPENCDRSLRFDARSVSAIESQLKREWMTNDAAKPHQSFWRHEWEKHGTCSVNIPQVSTQEQYFQMGLKLQQDYNLGQLLAKANIHPGKSYNVQTYIDGLSQVLGKQVFVTCIINKDTQELYLSEIRLCFNKQLQLTDCNGIYAFPTNCNRRKQVLYPDGVPGVSYSPLHF